MLGSALQTALSAISAAELAIQVTANNLANGQTDGFKSSRPLFSSSSSQTLSGGEAPSSSSGGTNPRQVGRGVQLRSVDTDFSQGTIAPSRGPLDLALEGPGFFVLEGSGGGQVYTRDGNFQQNAAGELVSASGQRVLGFNVDANFQLDTTSLQPIKIPQGPAASGATLSSLNVSQDGTIQGLFTDGVIRDLGQISLADFTNPGGLVAEGGNTFAEGPNSGLPSTPVGTQVVDGARELSNTDIGHELINLSLFSNMFRANLQVLDVGSSLLEELLNLRRT